MANGYIGKISALVTASTADLSRKLQGSTRDVNRFANSIQSQIAGASRAAQASLNGIFTPLQRIERALFAGRRLNLIDSSQVQQIQRAVSVAEGINKPLAAATRQFQGLSSEVQAQFLPALDLAQRRVAGLNDLLARSGNVSERAFGVTAERVERTAQAVQRLAQAQRAASAGFTGNELEFTNPRALEAINAAAAASQRAAALPASQRQDPAIAERVRQLQQFRNVVAQTVAEVEQIRLNPSVNTAALQAAEGRLDNIVETTRRAQRELDEIVNRGAAAQQRAQAASRFLQVDQRESQLTSLAGVATDRDASGRTIQERVAAINTTNQRAEAEARLRSEQERRVAVANTLLQIDQRESQLQSFEGQATTRDASGRTIQERVAAINATNQRAEAEARLRAEQEARLAVANSLLQVDQRESDLLSQRGRSTAIPTGRQGRARILETLGGEIDVVDRKVRALPESLLSQLGPAVNKITNDFRLLARDGVDFTAEQADKLAARLREVTAALDSRQAIGKNFLSSFGGAGEAGLNLGIDERELRGVGGQIEFLQNKLSKFTAQARGPAVAALQRYREVVTKVFADGAQNTERGRAAIDRAATSVVKLTARLAGVRTEKLAADLQRVGDVARGVGSKGGLAFQQLVFAVDDFFSVTGGLDQRLRAAGNNISQLGFILGGTAGLIAGVAASLVAQGVAAFIKWSGAAVEADDKAKALGETLKRQADLVNELREAFSTLGSDLIEGVFSSAALSAQKLAEQIERIIKLQRDLREDRVASFDPEVQQERALQGALERSKGEKGFLGRAKSLEELTAIEARIAASREREQRAAQRSVEDARGLRGQEGRIAAALAFPQTLRLLQARPGAAPTRELQAEARGIARQRAEEIAALPPAEREAAIRELREEVEAYLTSVRGEFNVGQSRIDDIAGTFDSVLEQFRLAASEATDPLAEGFAKEAAALRDKLARAGSTLEESIKEGIPGALSLRSELDRLGEAIRQGNKAIEESASLPPDQQKAIREGAIAGVREAERQLEAKQKEIVATDSARRSLEAFAESLDSAVGQIVEAAAGDARNAADQARRGANLLGGQESRGLAQRRDVEFAQRQRDRARTESQGIGLRAAGLRAEQAALRGRFVQNAAAGLLGPEVQGLVGERERARSVLDDRNAAPNAKIEAEAAIELVNQRLQAAFESLPEVQRLAGLADNLDAATQATIAFAEAIAEGRRLVLTDAQRAADDFIAQVQKINAALAAGEINQEQRDAAIARIRQDGLRQLAPSIFGLADQVANAVLQGPSRAALNATDVSTVEGSRELNRLLRGEDSARDQPLIELQREANKIAERIARGVENNEAKLAN
jgi:hypothetical protein